MTSVQLCALVVLAVVAISTASPHHKGGPMGEKFKAVMNDCKEKHPVADMKEAMRNPTPENGCFYLCMKEAAGDFMKSPDSPMAKDLASCEESTPVTDDKCADAYELKKCMKEKFMAAHPNFKGE